MDCCVKNLNDSKKLRDLFFHILPPHPQLFLILQENLQVDIIPENVFFLHMELKIRRKSPDHFMGGKSFEKGLMLSHSLLKGS